MHSDMIYQDHAAVLNRFLGLAGVCFVLSCTTGATMFAEAQSCALQAVAVAAGAAVVLVGFLMMPKQRGEEVKSNVSPAAHI